MDCSVKTKPGYQVFSPSFVAVFIGGNREELEERKNWHDMMKELLNAFEKWPRDMSEVAWLAGTTWIWNSILYHDIKDIRIKISNNKFSRKPGDRIKAVVHVLLGDYNGIQSMLTFEVKKKQEMKMLQTFAAETISNCFSKKEDIMYLGLPKQLLKDLNNEYDKIWRVEGKSISMTKRSCSASLASRLEAGHDRLAEALSDVIGFDWNECSDSCRYNFLFGICYCEVPGLLMD